MDLTKAAIPGFFGTMAAEAWWLKRRADRSGTPTAADYEPRDTAASLAMGTGSLILPYAIRRLLQDWRPVGGKHGRKLAAVAAGAAAATTAADFVARRRRRKGAPDSDRTTAIARQVSSVSGPIAVAATGVGITTTWGYYTSPKWLYEHRLLPDMGTGIGAIAAAIACWDFVYYWNHRFMHEWRFMWAIHVVHHSSERYNLSTALRQTWADSFGTFVPFFVAAFGVRPSLIEMARGVNLLYQYWFHTDAIDRMGKAEAVLNTPSHHRVHHGANPQYLDKNYGSIVITWDRLFGTFEPEDEPVVYGLTKNINTFNPLRIATHEHIDMMRDVSRADTWRDRIGFVVRGPGWSYARRAELDAAIA